MSSLASTVAAASVDPTPNPSPSLPGSGQVDRLSEYFDDIFGSGFGPLAFIGVIILVAIILWSIGRWVIKVVTQSIEDGLPVTERRARAALKKARISVAEETLDSRLERERRRQRAKTIRLVLNSTWAVLIITTTVLIVLGEVGISIAPLLASAGIVGVALGFGAQSLVKDLIAGVFMLVEDQYGVGDIIDVGEASGVVEEIGLRSVRLRSIDGTMWYVPNGNITRVGNMTRLWSRAMLEVKIGYDSDVEEARQAMLDAVEAARSQDEQVDGSILSEPDVPGIESFDYDSVTLRLLIQVQPATQWDVMRALRREIRREFAERGIQMALPHQGFKLDRPSPDTLREHTAETHADPASHPGKGETTRGGSVVRGDQGAEGDE